MRPKWPKLASLAQKIYTLWFQFFDTFFASKGYPFTNIFEFTTAGDWVCGGGRTSPCPSLKCRFYFLVLRDRGFHCGTLNLLEGH